MCHPALVHYDPARYGVIVIGNAKVLSKVRCMRSVCRVEVIQVPVAHCDHKHECMCVCVYLLYKDTCALIHTNSHTCIHIRMQMHASSHAHTQTHTHTYTHTHTHTRTHTHIHTHTHTHTHTYTHTHTLYDSPIPATTVAQDDKGLPRHGTTGGGSAG